ncbi:hypothetical protein P872_09615 [Rhodonellum psychrophilum GCM71 = DSM 17998]|uniref:Uncharacterized protein n=1 Tax=Rhodonellum psychrophilum GCM71 = DSM 17998 TaxID=1123057 RepID=U5BU27_9BACT|nr:hypothetical protein P872_09615 [Rhodonellum psychrophilum GCM71 = DSM 17998]
MKNSLLDKLGRFSIGFFFNTKKDYDQLKN